MYVYFSALSFLCATMPALHFSSLCDSSTAFGSTVQKWTCKDVTNWLKGLDDCVQPYFDRFIDSKVDGRELLMLTSADLLDIGVKSVGAQRIISNAMGLLHHLCYEMDNENLQTLTSNLSVQARNLANELKRSMDFSRTTNFGALPNNILWSISSLAEKTKKLVSWLDKPPFLTGQEYKLLRNSYLTIAIDIIEEGSKVTKATVDVRQMAKNVYMLCSQLYKICDELIEDAKDPLVIQTTYLERVEISKRTPTEELGMQLETTGDGLHVVKEVKFQTAADLCRKIEAGDEIVEINGQVVVGWSQSKLKTLLIADAAARPQRLILLLKKRPKHSWNIYKASPATPKLKKSRYNPQPTTPIEESSSAKLSPSAVEDVPAGAVVHRRRSSSLKMSRKLSDDKIINDKRLKSSTPNSPSSPVANVRLSSVEDDEVGVGDERQRRATISGGSPPLKRLSLHVNRKASLVPPKSPGQLQRHSIMNVPNQRPHFVFSPEIASRRPFIPSLNIPTNYSTSSLSSAEGEKSTSDDDNVFVVDKPSAFEFAEIETATPTADSVNADEWTPKTSVVNVTRDVMENWSGGLLNVHEATLPSVDVSPKPSIGGPIMVPDSYWSMPPKRKEKLKRFFGEIPSNLPKDGDDMSTSSSDGGRLSSSSASPKTPFKIYPPSLHFSSSTKKKKRSSGSTTFFYENESFSKKKTSTNTQLSASPTSSAVGLGDSPQLTNVRRNTSEQNFIEYGNERLRREYGLPCNNLYKVDFASWIYRTRYALEKRNTKWAKRWMVLRNDILYLYQKPTDAKAEGVIWLPGCRISPIGPEYKTSKKQWQNKLGLVSIGFFKTETGSTNGDNCSSYYFPGLIHDEDSNNQQCYGTPKAGHVNRPTTLQSQSSELLVQTLRKSFNRGVPSSPGQHKGLSRESSNDSVLSSQSDKSKFASSYTSGNLKEARSSSANRSATADVEKRKF